MNSLPALMNVDDDDKNAKSVIRYEIISLGLIRPVNLFSIDRPIYYSYFFKKLATR